MNKNNEKNENRQDKKIGISVVDKILLIAAGIILIIGGICYLIDPNMFALANIETQVDTSNMTKEEKIAYIEQKVNDILSRSYAENITEEIGDEILGETAKEYLSYFETKTVSAQITSYPNAFANIVPAPDAFNNQIYFYDNGKLIMYQSTSNTIGGNTKYYFLNDVLVDVVKNSEEPEYQNSITEDAQDILSKSTNVYSKYVKQENYTYSIYVKSNTDGYGIAGQYLKGEIKEKTYTIKENDTIDEELKLNNSKTTKPAIKVVKFNKYDAELEIYDWKTVKTVNVKYAEEFNFVPGYTVAMDGPVLDITLKITRNVK